MQVVLFEMRGLVISRVTKTTTRSDGSIVTRTREERRMSDGTVIVREEVVEAGGRLTPDGRPIPSPRLITNGKTREM